jgi:hypothetical protein
MINNLIMPTRIMPDVFLRLLRTSSQGITPSVVDSFFNSNSLYLCYILQFNYPKGNIYYNSSTNKYLFNYKNKYYDINGDLGNIDSKNLVLVDQSFINTNTESLVKDSYLIK